MIRVALIGVSGFGNVHYRELLQLRTKGEVELLGATIINRRQEVEKCAFLQSINCRIFDDYLAMLDALQGKVELCVIPTGILLHREMTVQALQQGMNVLVEKPAAPTAAELREMQIALRHTPDLFAAVGFQYNSLPSTMALKRRLTSGELGKVRRIKGICLWPRDMSYYRRNAWSGRLRVDGREVFDGPFSNAMAHYLMLALFFGGSTPEQAAMPQCVSGKLFRANPEIESCDAAELHYELENHLKLDFFCAHCCDMSIEPEITIEGEKGFARWTSHGIELHRAGEILQTIEMSASTDEVRTSMWRAVLSRIRGEKNGMFTSLELAMAETAAAEMAFRMLPIEVCDDVVPSICPETEAVRYVSKALEEELLKQYQ